MTPSDKLWKGPSLRSRTLNILHLVLSFRAGGRRNAIGNLATYSGAAVNCHACCLEELGCDRTELSNLFQSVSVLDRKAVGFVGACRHLVEICRDRNIDIIHAHDAASQYLGAVTRMVHPDVRLLMTFHRTLAFESERPRDKVRNAFCGLLSDAVVTASLERKSHFLDENFVEGRKLLVIPFGVNSNTMRSDPRARAEVRTALGLSDRTILIGSIGHFGPEKGLDLGIAAFNLLTASHPAMDVAHVVLGDGPARSRQTLQGLVAQNRVRRSVLVGFQTDVQRWLSACDIFLHTPRMEAFGLVVIEAMACKLPVVATAVGSMPEVVRNGVTGVLVDGRNITEIAEALAQLAEDADLRSRLGERGRAVARDEYSPELCASRYVELYHRIAHGDPLDIPHRRGGRGTGMPTHTNDQQLYGRVLL